MISCEGFALARAVLVPAMGVCNGKGQQDVVGVLEHEDSPKAKVRSMTRGQEWGFAGRSFACPLRTCASHAILAALARRLYCALSASTVRDWLRKLVLEPCDPQ
jgi:hypothetical protein